jgi:hypothetical protein
MTAGLFSNLTVADMVPPLKREFFMDNLLVRIHLIVEIILVDPPCAMVV